MFFKKIRKKSKRFFSLPKILTILRWSGKILVLAFIMDTGYLIGIWPDWKIYAEGPIQQSSFIRTYISKYSHHKN